MALTMKEMIKEVQKSLHTRPDGDPGRHTWSCFYLAMCKAKLPYSIRAFSNWLHVADPEKVKPFNPKGKSLRNFKNVISGSFSWKGQPISIMVSEGVVIRANSCHYWKKEPESVLWYTFDGKHGISQIINAEQLPMNVKWAIGGAGLKPGDAYIEGFVDAYSDVWRKTSHIIVGFDHYGNFNAVEVGYLNKAGMLSLINKLGLIDCVMLDGGSVTAANIDGHTRNINMPQYYAIELGE